MPKKILFVVTEDWYFCSHRLNLVKQALEAGFEVGVATRVQSHGNLIKEAGITLIPLVHMRRSGRYPIGELRSILELVRVYRRFSPDIVHHVAMKPMLYGAIAARLVGIKQVVQAISGFGFVFLSNTWRAKFLRLPVRAMLRFSLCRENTHVIVQNPDDAALAKQLGVNHAGLCLIEGSGVDTERFSPCPEPQGRVTVTLVARMLWDKGVGEFVEAVRLLREKGLDFNAQLVGEPDESNPASISLIQLQTWDENYDIDYCGRQSDIPKVWAESHIAVLPSYREGLPKSLLEAASCGRAMIATDVPGCRSVVKHKQTGLLVPVKNTGALADAIERLMIDSELRRRLGKQARTMVLKKFSDRVINDQILRLYHDEGSGQ